VSGRRLLLAAAVLTAAGPAAAFVRRTDSQTGACLYWAPREVFWTMRPPEAGAAPPSGILHPSCDGGAAEAAVRAGFAAWTGAAQGCTDLALTGRPAFTTSTFVGYDPRLPSAQQESLVVFRRGWCSQVVPPGDPCEVATGPDDTCPVRFNCFDDDGGPADWATIGQTITTFSRATGQLLDADIELNAWDGTGSGSAALTTSPPPQRGWYLTCLAPPAASQLCATFGQVDGGNGAPCLYLDLQNLVTHEAGHFIGLAHPADLAGNATLTMYGGSSPGEVSKRSLEADDVAGLCAIYPAGAPPSSCVAPPGDGSCLGCGSSGSGALALLVLFGLVPRLRRRR